jgi:hypothetical protein
MRSQETGVIYVPVMQGFFKTTALSASQLGICVLMGASVFVAVEVEKLVARLISFRTRTATRTR